MTTEPLATPMTMDRARVEAHRRWGSALVRGLVWHSPSGRRCVGWIDEGCRYLVGIGETWEEAFTRAEELYRD